MINNNLTNKGYSQRQLRVGELVKQSIGEILYKKRDKKYHHLIQGILQ